MSSGPAIDEQAPGGEPAGLLGRMRRQQASAPIAAAALRCASPLPATRLTPPDGRFNRDAAGLVMKWKDP